MATPLELSNFLKEVEKRAFKRTLYHVRDEDAALDIVQDSMLKLAQSYGEKPPEELPLLFQRILSNSTMDWFRRQKSHTAVISNFSDFQPGDGGEDFDVLDVLPHQLSGGLGQDPLQILQQSQSLQAIEQELQALPARQREAFLLRYWEDMDVKETAAVMGCTEGSVKTHCSRAVHRLMRVLSELGGRS
ncbi:MAG: RNA polymerase sigma factor [Rhodoferax sp.]